MTVAITETNLFSMGPPDSLWTYLSSGYIYNPRRNPHTLLCDSHRKMTDPAIQTEFRSSSKSRVNDSRESGVTSGGQGLSCLGMKKQAVRFIVHQEKLARFMTWNSIPCMWMLCATGDRLLRTISTVLAFSGTFSTGTEWLQPWFLVWSSGVLGFLHVSLLPSMSIYHLSFWSGTSSGLLYNGPCKPKDTTNRASGSDGSGSGKTGVVFFQSSG